MSLRERLSVAFWVAAVSGAFAFGTLCVFGAPEGPISPWAIAASVSAAALTAGVALSRVQRDQLARYRRRHKPLSGPRGGARLPS